MLYVVDDPTVPGELVGYADLPPRAGPAALRLLGGRERGRWPTTPTCCAALWRVVGSSGSQAPDVDVIGPAEDDLFLLLDHAAPDVVRSEIRWMLRLIDAPGAVAARGWPADAAGTRRTW